MRRSHRPSEVTGTFWKVGVSAGDPVCAHQTLVILESKKMEIPLTRSPALTSTFQTVPVTSDGRWMRGMGFS